MLEHNRDLLLQSNSFEQSFSEEHHEFELSGLDNVVLQQESIGKKGEKRLEGTASLAGVESAIAAVLRDNGKMARFQKVIAAASLYDRAVDEKDRIKCIFAIRESAANYLIERKSSSNADRKELCEKLITSIDRFAAEYDLRAEHDPSYVLDGRILTQDEINNEILLAQSLTGGQPLTEVTKERRDSFRKKIEEVRAANLIMGDIKKWKNEKSAFLAGKNREMGHFQSENELYDSVLMDSIMWYGRANNLKDESMTTLLGRMKTGDKEGADAVNIKARQIEVILSEIMSWNMDDFTFAKTEEFLSRRDKGETKRNHFLKLYSKLQLAKNADILLGEVLRMHEDAAIGGPLDFSEKTLEELKVRLKIYKEIEKDYSERLSIMSSPYYALLQQSDINDAMISKTDNALSSMKQSKEIPGINKTKQVSASFASYVDKLRAKRDRWDKTKLNDYFSRNTTIEQSITTLLEREGIVADERRVRITHEKNELMTSFAGNIQEQRQINMNQVSSAALNEPPEEEMRHISESMQNVRGRGFVPVERPSTRMGFFGKLKMYGMVGARWMFGTTVGVVGNIVGAFLGMPKQLSEKERVASSQKKRIHDLVPGTENERFADENIDEEKEILYDIRRAPLVWEKLTAGDPEDPPEVFIMADQSVRGSRETNIRHSNREIGHAMLGLSYSRYNKATGRKERYQLKMGFYPGGGLGPTNKAMMSVGAMVQGQLRDDSDHGYNIAKRYKVTTGDINRIIRASEKYADGGYGYYKRNCTTFVVDMARIANLPIADEAAAEEINFTGGVTMLANVMGGLAYGAYSMSANKIADRFQTKDKSYQNYGQKLTTKEDLDRYYETAINTDVVRKGYSPGALGETMRETEDGELTAAYSEDLNAKSEQLALLLVQTGEDLSRQIRSRLEGQIGARALEQSDHEVLYMLLDTDINLLDVVDKKGRDIPEKAKMMHRQIRSNMKKLGEYYTTRLKNDALLNEPVMRYLSMCEASLGLIDKAYADNITYKYTGEASEVLTDMTKEYEIQFRDGNGEYYVLGLSPESYLGYLKMGKTPGQIVKEGAELLRLRSIPNEEKTSEQKKREITLAREFYVANDFGYASRFTLYKDEFTKKDIQYAFSELPALDSKVEKNERLNGGFFAGHVPSNAYQAVILRKVFDGMGNLRFEAGKNRKEKMDVLDNYMTEKMNQNKDLMKDILSAYIKGRDAEDADSILESFLVAGMYKYIHSALRLTDLDVDDFDNMTVNIMSYNKTNDWLIDQIRLLRNKAD